MSSFEHVIVGAGIIGLTTAFELTRRGVDPRRIALVDPAPASGATNVAGGMLAPAAEVQYRQEPLYPLMLESAATTKVDSVRYPTSMPGRSAISEG